MRMWRPWQASLHVLPVPRICSAHLDNGYRCERHFISAILWVRYYRDCYHIVYLWHSQCTSRFTKCCALNQLYAPFQPINFHVSFIQLKPRRRNEFFPIHLSNLFRINKWCWFNCVRHSNTIYADDMFRLTRYWQLRIVAATRCDAFSISFKIGERGRSTHTHKNQLKVITAIKSREYRQRTFASSEILFSHTRSTRSKWCVCQWDV